MTAGLSRAAWVYLAVVYGVARWWSRVRSRVRLAGYELICMLVGHRYARHFTDMGAARPEDGERPWCDRCGEDRP